MTAQILVIGSINQDIVNFVARFPMPGETIRGRQTDYYSGGKGANQAVAAARSGAGVTFLGAVGDDIFGAKLVSSLENAGVNVENILTKPTATGTAFITISGTGENEIILNSGANAFLTTADLEAHLTLFEKADILLLQNEIPWPVTLFALEQAHLRGLKVYFNPAPVTAEIVEGLSLVDVLVVNENEIKEICRLLTGETLPEEQAMARLIKTGVKTVILTLGGKGVLTLDEAGKLNYVPAFKVEVIDTTGAGDVFIGTLAALESPDRDLEEALRFAAAAAALSITTRGVQNAMPTRTEILRFLEIER